MSDFRVYGESGTDVTFRVAATRPDNLGVQQPIDLTLPGTKLTIVGRLTPGDIVPLFVKDYWQAGGSPNGGVVVPAPGQAATNIAEITIPDTEAGLAALKKTSYVLIDVQLSEPNGKVSKLAGGVLKYRYVAPVPPPAPAPRIPPQIPIISRGVPVTDSSGSGGANAPARAVDGDYSTYWRSVTSPNGGVPQWIALDLRGVPDAQKTNLWLVWKGRGPYYLAAAALGSNPASQYVSIPRNYQLQGHVSPGAQPAAGDPGWTNIAPAVVDNRYNQRIHAGLNLSGYNWFRFYATAANGVTGASDDVQLQLDLRNVAASSQDSIFVYGDSISLEAFAGTRPDNAAWVNVGPFENALQLATGRVAPVLINGATIGWTASDGDVNKVLYIGGVPCKYVMLNFGQNDENGANIDLSTVGGVNSQFAQSFKLQMQNMVTYAESLDKIAIIPHILYGNLNPWSAVNVGILNTIIDQVRAANPTVLSGPDLTTLFQTHPNLLRDGLHPTWDNSVGAGLLNGLTGYEEYLTLWRDNIVASLYT